MGLKLNTESFIEKANIVHGGVYDYSSAKYVRSNTKIKIGCKKHGMFEQTPNNHLAKHGCPKCSTDLKKEKFSYSTEDFIKKANKIHTGFLDFLGLKDRNYYLPEWKSKPVDGFDAKTNTVYEFLGDYWHGNPSKYNPNDIHPHRKTTFKSLYKDTFELFDRIKEKGYRIKYIWESDWNAWNKQGNIPIKEY